MVNIGIEVKVANENLLDLVECGFQLHYFSDPNRKQSPFFSSDM